MDGIIVYYNLIVGMEGSFPTVFNLVSATDLVSQYKDAVIGQKQFLTWENGCIEMKNVLGVYKS